MLRITHKGDGSMTMSTVEIAEKALRARMRYESVKVEFANVNKALDTAKCEMINACNDVNGHWKIVFLASRIVEKEADTAAAYLRFQWYGVWCDQAEQFAALGMPRGSLLL
jgi:hypothetical protein